MVINMKKTGWIKLFCLLLAIGAIAFVSIVGFGSNAVGSYKDISLGLDLAGGVSITYQAVKDEPTAEEMEDARYKLMKRAEGKSTESAVYIEGTNRINVDIPNVTDANRILEEMGQVGSIYFIYGQGDDGIVNISFNEETGRYDKLTRSMAEIIASGNMVLDGSDVANAKAFIDNSEVTPRYLVELTLGDSGVSKFTEATTKVSKYYNPMSYDPRNIIAIVYDGVVQSAPRVQNTITGANAVIEGQETFEEAQELATTIRIGALPIELEEIRSQIVGAKLGEKAIETSLIAGLIGFVALIIFMIALYRIPGVAASIALVIYVGLMVISLNLFNVTLTLPGIAGIILSIGMAVDANVIIFSRIREEMAVGKTVRSAIKSGFKKAQSAIVDGNVTTLIAAVVLYLRGSGTVKGFAMTLGIGIVLSMITAMFITQFILKALYEIGFQSEGCVGTIGKGVKFDFVKHAPKFAIASVILVIIGASFLGINKANTGAIFKYSLDFVGGTSTSVSFEEVLPEGIQGRMEKTVQKATGKIAEISLVEESNSVLIKTTNLEQEDRSALEEALVTEYGIDAEKIQTENISSVVSGEMKKDALWASVIAIICMLIYIWIRFSNIRFGLSAIVALLHDVAIMIVVYAVASKFLTVGSTFIACILTILGYSINASIVVFDRIREDKKEFFASMSMKDIVNASISKSFSRSINTSLTTLFMVVALAILGVASVREFSIPLIVGIVAGAYSSVFLAGPLWFYLQKNEKTKEQEPEEP